MRGSTPIASHYNGYLKHGKRKKSQNNSHLLNYCSCKTQGDNILRVYLTVSAAACISYWNSLEGAFIHDDVFAIVRNKDIQVDNPWIDIFHHDFWGNDMQSNISHKSYRPLTMLSFR